MSILFYLLNFNFKRNLEIINKYWLRVYYILN
jgi:hypothetical protein